MDKMYESNYPPYPRDRDSIRGQYVIQVGTMIDTGKPLYLANDGFGLEATTNINEAFVYKDDLIAFDVARTMFNNPLFEAEVVILHINKEE